MKYPKIPNNFELKNMTTDYGQSKTNTGSYSYIRLNFTLKRLSNHHFVTIYIPSTMLVILSWLSFWIDFKDQILKCVISLFSLITLSLALIFLNENLPHVSYTKAIDLYTGVCLLFIFASIIQSVIVYQRHLRCTVNQNSLDDNQLDKHVSKLY